MSDEREDREISRPSLADAIDLLDLVRNSEEAARLSTEAPEPEPVEPAPITEPMLDAPRLSGPPAPHTIPPPLPPEEFVEVGDDAVDAPPSMPPERVSINPRASNPPRPSVPPKPVTLLAAKGVPEPASNAMPPVVGIILVLGLVIGGLYGILAWGAHDKADPKPEPSVAATAEPKTEPTVEPKVTPSATPIATVVPAAPPSLTASVTTFSAPPSVVTAMPSIPVVPKASVAPSASAAPAPAPEPLRPEASDLKVEGNPQQ